MSAQIFSPRNRFRAVQDFPFLLVHNGPKTWKSRPRQPGCNSALAKPNGLKFSEALQIGLVYVVANFQPFRVIIATFRA